MSIEVKGRSRTHKIKINRGEVGGGLKDLTSADRKVWAFYVAY